MGRPDAEKIVYFVRHGQSDGNISPVFQPPESPLTESGRRQAKRIAERMTGLDLDALISSPLARAWETAEQIAVATGKTPESSNLFVERIKPTSVAGRPHNDKEAGMLWDEWNRSLYTPGLRIEDGENFDDITIRADKALEFLSGREEKKIAVVTHGFFLKTIIARVVMGISLTPIALKNFQSRTSTENTGLSALRYGKILQLKEMGWRLWIYNDHAHLAD